MTVVHTCACGCGGVPPTPHKPVLARPSQAARDPFADRSVVDDQGCWVWLGYRLPGGYGQLTFRRDSWLAHRLSYFRHYGELPEGDLQVHHRCANRACLNPDHLEAATPVDNRRAAPTKLNLEKVEQIRALEEPFPRGRSPNGLEWIARRSVRSCGERSGGRNPRPDSLLRGSSLSRSEPSCC